MNHRCLGLAHDRIDGAESRMLNKAVLIVEHHLAEAKIIEEFFRRNNFRNKLRFVSSKSEALDYLFHTGIYSSDPDADTPGLILLDLDTNKTAEVEKLKPLQAYLRTQDIPIIIMISSPEQEHHVTEYHLGAVACSPKPLDLTRLIEAIQRMGLSTPSQTSS